MKNRVSQFIVIILLFHLFMNCSKNESETVLPVCEEPSFDVALGGRLEYIFTATFSSRNKVVYTWIVNNQPQEEDGATTKDIPDNTFSKVLTAGTHAVCIRIDDNCVGSRLFCREINASVTCETLNFKREDTRLIADFEKINSYPEYIWSVDGIEKKIDGALVNGNNKFDLTDLKPGTYEVCIKTPGCEEITNYCESIFIAESTHECPSLSFMRDGNILKSNFNNFQTLKTYSWFVDNVEVDVEANVNQRDNQFDLETLEDGNYTICIKSSLCNPTAVFCEQIQVTTYECRKLFFSVEGDKLVADFPGIEVEESYIWTVNGKEYKRDGIRNNGNNQLDLTSLDNGTYRVCILSEMCDEEFDFCDRSVLVGDENNAVCPSLNYVRKDNVLTANFTGIDTHNLYRWVVESEPKKDDGVSVNGNNQFDLSYLSPGVYKICIYSPNCSIGNYFCDRITIQ